MLRPTEGQSVWALTTLLIAACSLNSRLVVGINQKTGKAHYPIIEIMQEVEQEADSDGLPEGVGIEDSHPRNLHNTSYNFMVNALFRLPTQLVLTEAPPHNIAIMVRLKIADDPLSTAYFGSDEAKRSGGYLFAIRGTQRQNVTQSDADDSDNAPNTLNPLGEHWGDSQHQERQDPVQLGVRFGRYDRRRRLRNITLNFPIPIQNLSDADNKSDGVATVTVSVRGFDSNWHQLAIAIHDNQVDVYLDCALQVSQVIPGNYNWRLPMPLDVENEFYLAWSGDKRYPCPLVVTLNSLQLSWNPADASRMCDQWLPDDDEDSHSQSSGSSGSGSGDGFGSGSGDGFGSGSGSDEDPSSSSGQAPQPDKPRRRCSRRPTPAAASRGQSSRQDNAHNTEADRQSVDNRRAPGAPLQCQENLNLSISIIQQLNLPTDKTKFLTQIMGTMLSCGCSQSSSRSAGPAIQPYSSQGHPHQGQLPGGDDVDEDEECDDDDDGGDSYEEPAGVEQVATEAVTHATPGMTSSSTHPPSVPPTTQPPVSEETTTSAATDSPTSPTALPSATIRTEAETEIPKTRSEVEEEKPNNVEVIYRPDKLHEDEEEPERKPYDEQQKHQQQQQHSGLPSNIILLEKLDELKHYSQVGTTVLVDETQEVLIRFRTDWKVVPLVIRYGLGASESDTPPHHSAQDHTNPEQAARPGSIRNRHPADGIGHEHSDRIKATAHTSRPNNVQPLSTMPRDNVKRVPSTDSTVLSTSSETASPSTLPRSAHRAQTPSAAESITSVDGGPDGTKPPPGEWDHRATTLPPPLPSQTASRVSEDQADVRTEGHVDDSPATPDPLVLAVASERELNATPEPPPDGQKHIPKTQSNINLGEVLSTETQIAGTTLDMGSEDPYVTVELTEPPPEDTLSVSVSEDLVQLTPDTSIHKPYAALNEDREPVATQEWVLETDQAEATDLAVDKLQDPTPVPSFSSMFEEDIVPTMQVRGDIPSLPSPSNTKTHEPWNNNDKATPVEIIAVSPEPPSPDTANATAATSSIGEQQAHPRYPVCGNGVVEVGEECDDGNALDWDSCVYCKHARCGDGYVMRGAESCDGDATVDMRCSDFPGSRPGKISCSSQCRLLVSDCFSSASKLVRIAPLQRPRNGYLGGPHSADRLCRHEAKRHGTHGLYRAFLNSMSRLLAHAVPEFSLDRPVVNMKGEMLLRSWRTLLQDTGIQWTADVLSFSGQRLPYPRFAWLGFSMGASHSYTSQFSNLRAVASAATDSTCKNWKSISSHQFASAVLLTASTSDAGNLARRRCHERHLLLCYSVPSV